jgi:hypothetical protein
MLPSLSSRPPASYTPANAATAVEPIALLLEPITGPAIQEAIANPHLWQKIAESIAAGAPIAKGAFAGLAVGAKYLAIASALVVAWDTAFPSRMTDTGPALAAVRIAEAIVADNPGYSFDGLFLRDETGTSILGIAAGGFFSVDPEPEPEPDASPVIPPPDQYQHDLAREAREIIERLRKADPARPGTTFEERLEEKLAWLWENDRILAMEVESQARTLQLPPGTGGSGGTVEAEAAGAEAPQTEAERTAAEDVGELMRRALITGEDPDDLVQPLLDEAAAASNHDLFEALRAELQAAKAALTEARSIFFNALQEAEATGGSVQDLVLPAWEAADPVVKGLLEELVLRDRSGRFQGEIAKSTFERLVNEARDPEELAGLVDMTLEELLGNGQVTQFLELRRLWITSEPEDLMPINPQDVAVKLIFLAAEQATETGEDFDTILEGLLEGAPDRLVDRVRFMLRRIRGDEGDAGTKDLKGAEEKDFLVGSGGETAASFRDRYGVELRTLSDSSQALSGFFKLLGYQNISATFDGISEGMDFYLDRSVSNALSGALFAAGQFGGEKGAQIASLGGTTMAGYGAIANPGFGSILTAATSIGGQVGVNEHLLNAARGVGSLWKLAGATTPAAAAIALFEVAMLLDHYLGKPNVARLSTMIDGQEVPVEYGISANEFRYFLDPDGRAPHGFTGVIEDRGGRFFLGGAFGYDPLNPFSGEGEGVLPGTRMVRGIPVQFWRPPSVTNDLEIDADFARQFLNGARKASLNVGVDDPLFAMVADKLGLVQHVRYTTPGDMGLMAGSNDRMLLFSHPGIPGSLDSRSYVDAHYFSPIQAGSYRFRDAQQATLFGDFGLLAAQMVAGDHALAAGFGGFDAQRILDHVGGNFDAMSGNPLFDVFAYLGANDDVRRAVGGNLMQGISHWMNHGVHEGRPFVADENARNRAIAWVGGLSLFDEAAYLALNPDVAAAVAAGGFASGRAHYEMNGFDEGRKPFFDEAGYLARYPDVAEAIANGGIPSALDHWTHHGQFEGRDIDPAPQMTASGFEQGQSHPDRAFDERAYLAANPEVAAAIANGTMDSAHGHWERHGQFEGREFFDEQAYLAKHQGVAEAVANGTMDSAIGHWERHGQYEGFGIAVSQDAPIAPVAEPQPQPQTYSAEAYVATRPDLIAAAQAEGRALDEFANAHFAAYGEAEGSVFA